MEGGSSGERRFSTFLLHQINWVFQVSYRDVPGIDCAYLAMDTEEGVEVIIAPKASAEGACI